MEVPAPSITAIVINGVIEKEKWKWRREHQSAGEREETRPDEPEGRQCALEKDLYAEKVIYKLREVESEVGGL